MLHRIVDQDGSLKAELRLEPVSENHSWDPFAAKLAGIFPILGWSLEEREGHIWASKSLDARDISRVDTNELQEKIDQAQAAFSRRVQSIMDFAAMMVLFRNEEVRKHFGLPADP